LTRLVLPRIGLAFALAAAWLGACRSLATAAAPTGPLEAQVRFEREDGEPLPPIADADWLAAWPAWLSSCQALASPHNPRRHTWLAVCDDAQRLVPRGGAQVRDFFARHMDRYRVLALEARADPDATPREAWSPARGARVREHSSGLVTGYYEPVLAGSRQRVAPFVVPVYRPPPVLPTAARAELEASGQLRGQELLWVREAVEAFFLEVQGSGRIQLTDGTSIRLAYAANNGQPYRSIGRWLVAQGELAPDQVSLQAIRDWARAHPRRVRELLDQNPRVVFFRELPLGDADAGPVGALGVALTPGVSVAIDPRFLPLGAPLLLYTSAPASGEPLARIVVAQDTGAAIRGALRIDWFWGQGTLAEEISGRQHAQGSVRLLVPRGVAPAALL